MAKAETLVTIAHVFDRCQRSFTYHGRGLKELACLKTEDPEAFELQFVGQLRKLLICFTREPAVERLRNFVVRFLTCTEQENSEPNQKEQECCEDSETDDFSQTLFLSVLRFMLKHINGKSKAIRFRCCQLIAGLLQNLPEGAEIEYVPTFSPTSPYSSTATLFGMTCLSTCCFEPEIRFQTFAAKL